MFLFRYSAPLLLPLCFLLGVPSFSSSISISAWRSTEVPHKAELENVWLHVEGVPHTLRHFLGMWAVGSLVGKTVDVDLTSLRRRAIVRIQVAMLHPGVLGDPSDEACPIAKADAGQVQGLRVPFLQGAS
jgi:hypothetical protein